MGMICQEKKKTQFWLCPCSAREERQNPFLSVGTELCWDIWSIYFTNSLCFSPRAGRAKT